MECSSPAIWQFGFQVPEVVPSAQHHKSSFLILKELHERSSIILYLNLRCIIRAANTTGLYLSPPLQHERPDISPAPVLLHLSHHISFWLQKQAASWHRQLPFTPSVSKPMWWTPCNEAKVSSALSTQLHFTSFYNTFQKHHYHIPGNEAQPKQSNLRLHPRDAQKAAVMTQRSELVSTDVRFLQYLSWLRLWQIHAYPFWRVSSTRQLGIKKLPSRDQQSWKQ